MARRFVNLVGGDEYGKGESRQHLHILRSEKQAAPVHTVGNHAAHQREEKDRNLTEGDVDRQPAGLVNSKTSQFWATSCIHVPMDEVHAPIHMRRNCWYWNALKTRENTIG